MTAIGIGCRRDTPAAAIEALIRQALAQAPPTTVMVGEGPSSTTVMVGEGPPPTSLPRLILEGVDGGPPATMTRNGSCNPKGDAVIVGHRFRPANVPTSQPALFTIEDKANESGLIQAAQNLNLHLTFLPRTALRAQTVQTLSHRTESLFGVPSVAEAAALAGAGPNATLIVRRIAAHGVTCAIARTP